MNNNNDSFEEFWQGIDVLKQNQSPMTPTSIIKRPKIGVQQQLFKWLKPVEDNKKASTSPSLLKPLTRFFKFY